jgi:tRNA dimethylallyltransferase
MDRLIAIIGPTAVGKTQVSIDLAKLLHTEIISGDSMLVYRGMNIGTAKPDIREQDGIVHHLIDSLDPTDNFSVADFQLIAGQHITLINKQNKIPILAGGTGLYVKALLEGYQFNATSGDEQFRIRMDNLAQKYGNQYLHDKLAQVSPDTAGRLHSNDLRRIIRALEVDHLSGDTISQRKMVNSNQLMYDAVVIGLTMERSLLYDRINQRVDDMIAGGLVDEVACLLKKGIHADSQAMQGIGYKEIIAYLQGEINLETAILNIKQATRHFAKRQLTWYRKMPYIEWFDVTSFKNHSEMMVSFYKSIAGKFHLE